MVDMTGLGPLIPVCVYSFIFHHSLPVLVEPVKRKETYVTH